MSTAWLSLSGPASKILILLLDKRQRESQKRAKDRKGGKRAAIFTNSDRIKLTYLELIKKHHFGQQTIVRAIDDLLSKGFIEIRHHGGTGQHDVTLYAVPPLVMNWRTWHPGMKPFNTRPKDVHRGYQGKKVGVMRKFRTQDVTHIDAQDVNLIPRVESPDVTL